MDTDAVDPIRYEFVLPLLDEIASLESGVRIIAIDGRSGAGKTSLATAIAQRLDAPILTVDEMCPGWDGLAAVPALLAATLKPLAHGRPGRYRRYDWVKGALAEVVEVAATPWLVVDGVGSGSRACRPWLSYLIWLEADRVLRKHRALARDGAAFARVWDRWAQQEDQLFGRERTVAAADAVLTEDAQTGILGLRPVQ